MGRPWPPKKLKSIYFSHLPEIEIGSVVIVHGIDPLSKVIGADIAYGVHGVGVHRWLTKLGVARIEQQILDLFVARVKWLVLADWGKTPDKIGVAHCRQAGFLLYVHGIKMEITTNWQTELMFFIVSMGHLWADFFQFLTIIIWNIRRNPSEIHMCLESAHRDLQISVISLVQAFLVSEILMKRQFEVFVYFSRQFIMS